MTADGGVHCLGPSAADRREHMLQDVGEAAIQHHFACSRARLLHHSLVPDGIDYRCGECWAEVTVGRDGKAIAPVAAGAPVPTPQDPGVPDDPEVRGLRRSDILAARAAWLAGGPKSEAIWRRLGTSDATLARARRDLGLVPWPKD